MPFRMFTQVVFPLGIRIEDVWITTSRKLPLELGLINYILVVNFTSSFVFPPKIFALTNSTKFLIRIFV